MTGLRGRFVEPWRTSSDVPGLRSIEQGKEEELER